MPVKFRRHSISAEPFESVGVADVNGDGQLDLIHGDSWYEGPTFTKRHRIGPVARHGEYFGDFSTIIMDINGDGRPDFITGDWWGETLRWRENPGDPTKEWPEHVIATVGNVETTRAWDVDRDGELEIVPNTPNGPLAYYKLVRDKSGNATGQFTRHEIYSQPSQHGLGFGDISGSGRGDFVLKHGWLEQPKIITDPWTFHPDFDLHWASIPVLVVDVNGDGINDLICGQAHDYGLDWWEQKRDAGGKRTWIKHLIDPFASQYHDLHWVDIDNDGKPELVTGKRYRAHNDNDPGAHDEAGIYYFKWTGESFVKHVIAHGPLGIGKGTGISMQLVDLRRTGRLDVIAPGKDGLTIFYNEGL